MELNVFGFFSVINSVESVWWKSRGVKEWAFFEGLSSVVEHGQIGGQGKFFYQGEAQVTIAA